MGDRLSIGAVARLTGVTRDAIRYDERLGLLPAPVRTAAGYRQYGGGVVSRLRLIRTAQQFGCSLRDIRSFVGVRDAGGKPCHDVRRAAGLELHTVERQISDLVATRKRMQRTLRAWDRTLAVTSADQPAYLLETLEPIAHPRHERRSSLKDR